MNKKSNSQFTLNKIANVPITIENLKITKPKRHSLSVHSASQQLQANVSSFYWQVSYLFDNANQKFKYHLKMFQAALI